MIETKQKHPLEQIKWGIIPITNYKGVLITKIIGGYAHKEHKFKTPEEVDEYLEATYKVIDNSIIS